MKQFGWRTAAALVLMLLVVAMGVRFSTASKEPEFELPASVVLLPNGVPFEAAPGSQDRELIEWMNGQGRDQRDLEYANRQFEPGSATPTAGFHAFIGKFAVILASFENVDVHISIGKAGKQDHVATSVSVARVSYVADQLRSAGVADSRLDSNINPDDATSQPSGARKRLDSDVLMVLTRS